MRYPRLAIFSLAKSALFLIESIFWFWVHLVSNVIFSLADCIYHLVNMRQLSLLPVREQRSFFVLESTLGAIAPQTDCFIQSDWLLATAFLILAMCIPFLSFVLYAHTTTLICSCSYFNHRHIPLYNYSSTHGTSSPMFFSGSLPHITPSLDLETVLLVAKVYADDVAYPTK